MKQEESLLDIAQEYMVSDQTVLLPFDRNALRIQQEVAKDAPDGRMIEKLIVSDPALTSQVLRMANSAFYKGLRKVSTVRNAMTRIGLVEISNIVTLVKHRRNFKADHPVDREMMAKLWAHSVGCAIGSQWIAKKRKFADLIHEAFVAGLLHDVGKLFQITMIDACMTSGRIVSHPSPELIHEFMESMHAEYGHALLQNWNLPREYCEVALKHHDETCEDRKILLLMVRLANYACNKIGIGLRKDSEQLLASTPEAHVLGLSEVALAELEIKLEDSLKLLL